MDILDLNNEINIGKRHFQIKTAYYEEEGIIHTTVLSEDYLIEEKSLFVENIDSEVLIEQQKEFHHDMITDIELLYYIAEKVKTVKHSVSNHKLGKVFLKRNLLSEAIEQFKLANQNQADYLEAINNLGVAYLLARNYSEAIKIFQDGIKITDTYADLHKNLGYAHFELEQYSESIRAFERALELNPDYAEAHFNLAQVFIKIQAENREENENANQQFNQDELKEKIQNHLLMAAELMPPENIKYFDQIDEQLAGENYEKIFKLLEIIKTNSTRHFQFDVENEFYLKFMFGGKGKDDKFISEYTNILNEMIKEYPDYADLRNNLGIVYLIQCRNLFLKALDEFRQALKLNPSFKKAAKNLKLAENDGKGFLILLRAILK